MAFAGLYGGLPSAKDDKDDAASNKKEGWSASGLFAPNLAAKRQGEHCAALLPLCDRRHIGGGAVDRA